MPAKKPSGTARKMKNLKPAGDKVQGGDNKVLSSTVSNVSKTRSDISATFARNLRG